MKQITTRVSYTDLTHCVCIVFVVVRGHVVCRFILKQGVVILQAAYFLSFQFSDKGESDGDGDSNEKREDGEESVERAKKVKKKGTPKNICKDPSPSTNKKRTKLLR